jgi:hypothetical protein
MAVSLHKVHLMSAIVVLVVSCHGCACVRFNCYVVRVLTGIYMGHPWRLAALCGQLLNAGKSM